MFTLAAFLLSFAAAACPESVPGLDDSVLVAELLLSGYAPIDHERLRCRDGDIEIELHEDRVLGSYSSVDHGAAKEWLSTMRDHFEAGTAKSTTCTPRPGATCVAYNKGGVRHVLELEPDPKGDVRGQAGIESRRLRRKSDERVWFPHAKVTLRGGYDRYFTFNFYTFGGEVALDVVSGIQVVGAVEAWSVRMAYPNAPEHQFWSHMNPISGGLLYQWGKGPGRPYAGAEVITAMYYQDEVGQDWAAGGRARVGSDFMISEHVGLNANLAVGMWSGTNLPLIQGGVGATGALVQGSGGIVFAL